MRQKILLALLIILVVILNWSSLNFQDSLSTGDHGRDLYASVAVYRGELPFKDFWWVYGPLMPYYYGLFDLALGVSIKSVLIGKLFLKIACAVLFYFGGSVIMSPLWAFMAALWFAGVQADFFFTYNHIGGIVTTLGALWMGLAFLKKPDLKYAWVALVFIAVGGLIKINFAMSAGAAIGLAFIVQWIAQPNYRAQAFDTKHRLYYASAVVGLPLVWLVIYLFFLQGLSITEIRQCLPYMGGDQPYNYSPSFTIPYYFTQHWLTLVHQWKSFSQLITALQQNNSLLGNPSFLLFFGSGLLNLLLHPLWHCSTIYAWMRHSFLKSDAEDKRLFWVCTVFLLGFFVLNFHEFVVSGVWYRSYWAQPMLVMFHFFMISTAVKYAPKFVGWIITAILTFLLVISFIAQYQTTAQRQTPTQLLSDKRGGIYVGNEPAWVDTVTKTSQFLQATLKPGEQFFAMPYDVMYYYLTNTKTPTRQLIFFDHIKITTEQEKSIIGELEKNHTAYVLISNRISSTETGLGIFGKTYCPLLYQYVMSNFAPVFKYGGNWQAEPGWANNHGVIVFKRK